MKPLISPVSRVPHVHSPTRRHVPVVVLAPSEVLSVVGTDGRPLLEVSYGEKGPCIRLARNDVHLQCDGALDLSADSISLQAKQDVTVQGKTIRLN